MTYNNIGSYCNRFQTRQMVQVIGPFFGKTQSTLQCFPMYEAQLTVQFDRRLFSKKCTLYTLELLLLFFLILCVPDK